MLAKMAVRNLWRNPRRTLVTVVTICVGTAGLLLFQGFNVGVQVANAEHVIHGKYGHGQVFVKGYRGESHDKPWDLWIQDVETMAKEINEIPEVHATFQRSGFSALVSNGQKTIGGRGFGVEGRKEADFFNMMRIVSGTDLGDTEDGIVLGHGLARSLGVAVGDTVMIIGNTTTGSINGIEGNVVGIFQIGQPEIDDYVFQVQQAKARELLDTERTELLAIGLKDADAWPQVAAAIHEKFPTVEAVHFAELDKIWYQQTVDWLDAQFNVIRTIILAIVVLGIFNTASTAILERTREFGILRANGESSGDLLRLLSLEGVVVAIFGGMCGLIIVLILDLTVLRTGVQMPSPPGYTHIAPVLLHFTVPMVIDAFVTTAIVAALATVGAGIKVARQPISSSLTSV